eukprot:scaffold13576_cov19-Tisochrysis_lutea.AAC.2
MAKAAQMGGPQILARPTASASTRPPPPLVRPFLSCKCAVQHPICSRTVPDQAAPPPKGDHPKMQDAP